MRTKSGNVMESRRQGLFYGSVHETMGWSPAGDVPPINTVRWLKKVRLLQRDDSARLVANLGKLC